MRVCACACVRVCVCARIPLNSVPCDLVHGIHCASCHSDQKFCETVMLLLCLNYARSDRKPAGGPDPFGRQVAEAEQDSPETPLAERVAGQRRHGGHQKTGPQQLRRSTH